MEFPSEYVSDTGDILTYTENERLKLLVKTLFFQLWRRLPGRYENEIPITDVLLENIENDMKSCNINPYPLT